MDARQLRFFHGVIDYGGFSRAAEQLFNAQQSLSQAIAGLERELGVSLFHRVGRGVLPTDAGKELIGPARQVLRDLATASSSLILPLVLAGVADAVLPAGWTGHRPPRRCSGRTRAPVGRSP